jgi:nucleotide-binding universal stress UspA family protein
VYPRDVKVRRILCAIDFSEPAREALHYSSDLARLFDAELTLYHVYHIPGYGMPEGSFVLPGPDTMAAMFAKIDEQLEDWKRQATERGAPRVEVATAQGSPWHEIVERARADYQLVVVGTHGHSGLRHMLIGSVADRVVRHAPCPVLTVRPSDHALE